MSAITESRRALDAPDFLVSGLELGRTINAGPALERFGPKRVGLIADYYCLGDEVGYRAWKSLAGASPRGAGKAMLHRAIEDGIEAVEGAPQELVDLFREVDHPPAWMSPEQLRRGAIAYWRAGRLVPAAIVYGGIGPGLRYGGTRPLLFSRRLVDRAPSLQRLLETLRWVVAATTPDGMSRYADGFKFTLHVRMLHASVRDFISRSPHWAWNEWGLPINMSDGLYQGGGLFCATVVDSLEKLGVRFSREEREDIFALWRYLNHVMGVPEPLNFVDEADMRTKMEVSEFLERDPDDGCREALRTLFSVVCEDIEDYHILPEFIDKRLTVEQKLQLTYGLCRGLMGDELAEKFHIPASRLSVLVPAANALGVVIESVARRLPHDDEATCRATLASFGKVLRIEAGQTAIADPDDQRVAMEAKGHRMAEHLRGGSA